MHELNLKMTKIILIVIILSVICIIMSGITVLKNSYYWRDVFFKMQWNYLKTESAFIDYYYGGKINWLSSLFQKKNVAKTINSENTDSIPILLYHGIINTPGWQPDGVSTSLEEFSDQMFALKKHGYQTIKMEDYLDFIHAKKSLPKKSFLLTFDDGRKDSFYPVDPILKTLGFNAVMNVITSRSLGPDSEKSVFHLSQMELQKMIESGRWQIESHGKDDHDEQIIGSNGEKGHFLSNKLWLADQQRLETVDEFKNRVYRDLFESKTSLEKSLGIKVLAFAYPFGDFGQIDANFPESRDIIIGLANLIYPLSFVQAGSSDFPVNYAEDSLMAKRISIGSGLNGEQLQKMLVNLESKPANYKDNFSEDNGWLRGWGTVNISNNRLNISDSQFEDSGLAFLGGSYLWKDYWVKARANISKGTAFAIGARYYDENNYVACDFADGHVTLSQRVNGTDLPDIEIIGDNNISRGRDVESGIFISGKQAGCYLDGKLIVEGTIDDRLEHGGINFKIWNTGQKGSALSVKELEVSDKSLY